MAETAAAADLPAGEPLAAVLEEAVGRLSGVMADVRHYVFDLRARIGERDGLEARLRALVASLQAGPLFQTVLRCEGEAREVARPVLWELWHIAREALTNAVRHSGGDRLEVLLVYDPDALVLDVADNGRGWDGTPPSDARNGWRNMHRRAAAIGAALSIQGTSGAGTRVRVTVPAAVAFALAGAAVEA